MVKRVVEAYVFAYGVKLFSDGICNIACFVKLMDSGAAGEGLDNVKLYMSCSNIKNGAVVMLLKHISAIEG